MELYWICILKIPQDQDAYEYNLGQIYAGGNQCSNGNFTVEGACYNRDHSLPKSFFRNAAPMANEAHFLIPTDYYVNQQRY